MKEQTRTERALDGPEVAAAALDRGKEKLEEAKAEIADRADRLADAVDRTSDELHEDGDGAVSGFGHSIASLMRQMSGGLRERDIEQFARELGDLARRNPGVFLAGSVAAGFGIARFFKARPPAQVSPDVSGRDWDWSAPRSNGSQEQETDAPKGGQS
jgi:hypothetical protein